MTTETKPESIYCLTCKEKKDVYGVEDVTLTNGRSAIRGVCPDCGRKVFRIGNRQAS